MEMHGGQAIPAFDFLLAPYVKLTWIEEVKKVEEVIGTDLSQFYEFPEDDYDKEVSSPYLNAARKQTINRVHQAMESFIHNMNSIHSRGGNQVVFSSINYGTDTSPEGRLIIRELLKSTDDGVGNGETAIFPLI